MQVAAGKNHPLVNGGASGFVEVSAEQLLVHPFVSPSISPYCGQARGIGCDGWRNDLFPRQLKIEVNDYSVLGQLVRSGQALAYLPDYWVRELELIQLQIKNFDYVYQEKLLLVSYQSDLIDLFKP
jgi:DNA-binding transcriptional LysR family regulator